MITPTFNVGSSTYKSSAGEIDVDMDGFEIVDTLPSEVPYISNVKDGMLKSIVGWISKYSAVSFLNLKSVVGEYTVASSPGGEPCS